mmetsp:Transcript_39253/g.78608  ORF Transcript_39253/g.78608 Transcript_39253/m.78608 type:complete len:454 (-) Transcript_39253:83-1444(-)
MKSPTSPVLRDHHARRHSWQDLEIPSDADSHLKPTQTPHSTEHKGVLSFIKRRAPQFGLSFSASVAGKKSGSSTPLGRRTPEVGSPLPGAWKSTRSVHRPGNDNKSPSVAGDEFEVGKILMPVDKAVRTVTEVNEELKVLKKMDEIPPQSDILSKRRREAQAQKAGELIQKLKTIYILDVAERTTFQPLHDRVMDQLLQYADPAHHDVNSSRSACGSFVLDHQQHAFLQRVTHRLNLIKSPTSGFSRSSSSSSSTASNRKTAEVDTSVSVGERETLPNPSGAESASMQDSKPKPKPESEIPRNSSSNALFEELLSEQSEGSTSGGQARSMMPRNSSSDSLFDQLLAAQSVSGSQQAAIMPRNNSAQSLFDALLAAQGKEGSSECGSGDGRSVRSSLSGMPRIGSNNSLFDALLAVQSRSNSPAVGNMSRSGSISTVVSHFTTQQPEDHGVQGL